jgi:hypothetical protein
MEVLESCASGDSIGRSSPDLSTRSVDESKPNLLRRNVEPALVSAATDRDTAPHKNNSKNRATDHFVHQTLLTLDRSMFLRTNP